MDVRTSKQPTKKNEQIPLKKTDYSENHSQTITNIEKESNNRTEIETLECNIETIDENEPRWFETITKLLSEEVGSQLNALLEDGNKLNH